MPFRRLLTAIRAHLHQQDLRRQLRRAEAELRASEPDQRGILLDRIGDLHLELGDERAALAFFGGSIDACLGSGNLDSAAALCRKLMSVCPDVVRAHGTLGCLLLARGSIRQAEWELVQYVQGARRQGTAGYARDRLRMLVHAFPDHASRHLLARLLREMGEAAAAAEIEQSLDPEISPKRQRRMLASMLTRTVLPGMLDDAAPGAEPWSAADLEEKEDEKEPPQAELPFMDTTVLRAAARRPRRASAPKPAPVANTEDLPWLDTDLAETDDDGTSAQAGAEATVPGAEEAAPTPARVRPARAHG